MPKYINLPVSPELEEYLDAKRCNVNGKTETWEQFLLRISQGW